MKLKLYDAHRTLFAIGLLVLSTSMIQAEGGNDSFESFTPELTSTVQTPRKPINEEQAVEELEAYYIDQLFSDTVSLNKSSLLSDEEKEEIGFAVDTSVQDDIQKKEFSKILAKQDILGLKKLILKKKKTYPSNYERKQQQFN